MTVELFIPFIFFFLAFLSYSLRNTNFLFPSQIKVFADIKQDLQNFKLRESVLREVMAEFDKQLTNCLLVSRRHITPEKRTSSLESYNTYVQVLPNGQESGRFLGLCLKGTDCRIVVIRVKRAKMNQTVERFRIPFELLGKSTSLLFDFIAKQISSFINVNNLTHKTLHLAFSCDFPVRQEQLSVAVLKNWTHGFHCSGGVGKDLVHHLSSAILRERLYNVKVIGMLADVTGALIDCHWKDRRCVIGLKLDATTNACYVEKTRNIVDFDGEHDIPYTVINTEWGTFGDNGELDFAANQWDRQTNEKGISDLEFFNKMVAPGPMAELLRMVMLKYAKKRILFGGRESKLLNTRGSVMPFHMYQIESEAPGSYSNCKTVLAALDIYSATDEDCENVRYICKMLTTRSANLVAAVLSTLINRTPFKNVTVGVEGPLHRYHPYYHERLETAVARLVDPEKIVAIKPAGDGKGRGAALLAACYTRHFGSEMVE